MDSHDGWCLQPVAEPVSYFNSRTGAMHSGNFETAVKSEQCPAQCAKCSPPRGAVLAAAVSL